ncbi:DUF2516 family protein [Dermatophilus congolensis]|uniref:Protein of uncharacterized function (DUF2516) n=1 Tax=Dermatophilus congolensis TaxID=1863 RepID=A0AA46BLI9_9MICO|nr:DUF2516 family protein [Dermatophilus congolensis]MBO3142060.1 DUF2516 family protein [Dermatophilus congolensis]MBO3151052.1 DUF2516 family protein [Dermatophilus congolensis]MBO3161944.1 DUF2516 family protein [Dermatophilus congolensis]MBO3162337.1 DUF2516 family protein [Dermatophilus congolensis]MBO3175892.1 DUF2516 family protein [Dermatophilus congolensis]
MLATLMTLQSFALLALGVIAFGASLWALVDSALHPAGSYQAAEKLTKPVWVGINAVAALITFVGVTNVAGLGAFSLIAIVAVGVYFADARPALRQYTPMIKRRKDSSGGFGPHGSW